MLKKTLKNYQTRETIEATKKSEPILTYSVITELLIIKEKL